MKNYLVRFLVWLLRKVRGEDPAPTVEPGSRIVHGGVEYVCTCTELDTDPFPNGAPLQMSFYRWEAMKETLRIVHPMPMLEFTVDYDVADYELAMAAELKNDWGVPAETLDNGNACNDGLDCQIYTQAALEMLRASASNVLQPATPDTPVTGEKRPCESCLCSRCHNQSCTWGEGGTHPCYVCVPGDPPHYPRTSPRCSNYTGKCEICLCSGCKDNCHRGPVHPCEGCKGDAPYLLFNQRCPSRELWG